MRHHLRLAKRSIRGRFGVFVLVVAASNGCYRLGGKDIFEVPFAPMSATTLAELSDQHHHVQKLTIETAPSLSAYWDDGDSARAVLVFFDGNGYGAEGALRRMLVPARALGLDLVVFNYYDTGQPRPSMSEMRRVGDALFDAATRLPTPAARRVYLGGHSLGSTFALAAAADRPAKGVFVAAPATTGVAMLHHQLPATRLVWLRPDSDYAAFNNLAIAPRVHVPTLVIGSTGDEALPPTFTNAVFAALPHDTANKELILTGVRHSEYFAGEEFWRAVTAFFDLRGEGPFVGYLRPRAPR